MDEAKNKLGMVRVVIVWIEMGILFLIGVVSLLKTMEVVEYDGNYRNYYLLGLVGIAFITVLYLLAQKGIKWVWLLGFPFIAAFAVVVWLGYVPADDRAKAVERYAELVDREIVVEVNGTEYDWHDYKTVKDEDLSSHTQEIRAKAKVDEEEQAWVLYYDSAEDILYSTGDTGASKYLMVLQKKKTE